MRRGGAIYTSMSSASTRPSCSSQGPSSGRSYTDGRAISQGRFDRLQAARFIQIAETSLLNVWGCMTTRAVGSYDYSVPYTGGPGRTYESPPKQVQKCLIRNAEKAAEVHCFSQRLRAWRML